MIRQSVSTQSRSKLDKAEPVGNVLVVSADAANTLNVPQTAPFTLTRVHAAAVALELCQTQRFDLALIDVQTKESSASENAMELARALREHHELRTLFVMWDDQFELIHDAEAVGAIGLLAGPCSSEYLLLALRVAIARALELRTLANRESQLVTALSAEREINTAIGILMERMQLTRTDAFETLRRYARSQRQQMAQIAAKMLQSVNETNELLSVIGALHGGKAAKQPQ